MHTKLSTLLEAKGCNVFKVSPDNSVYEAVKLMSEKHIGALLVMNEHKVVGILSERDINRRIVVEKKNAETTVVCEVMTKNVLTVTSDCTVEAALSIITQKRFRHLPVVDEGKLKGLISIGDLTKTLVEHQKEHIDHLEKYIGGDYH